MKEVYPTLSLKERDRRWSLTRELMKARGVDVLIVPGLMGGQAFDAYLSGESGHGIVVFPREGELTYLVPTLSPIIRHMEDGLRGGVSWLEDWRIGTAGPQLVALLREKGFDSATISVAGEGAVSGAAATAGGDSFSYTTWSYVLEQLPGATFVDVSRAFVELMLVKSDEEIALLRHSAKVGEMACEAMLKVTRPGVSESKIYTTIVNTIFSNGLNSAMCILQTGVDNASWGPPQWIYRAQPPRIVQEGDMVQAEIFPCYGGQETQQQMSLALKPVHPVNEELAGIVRQSYELGLKALRPGKTFQEVCEAMEVPINEAGCWTQTPLIHSLNPRGGWFTSSRRIRVHQMPGIEKYQWIQSAPLRGGDLVIKPDMVFAFEPNACRGRHRANLGGTVLVTQDGAEELNTLANEVRVVDTGIL